MCSFSKQLVPWFVWNILHVEAFHKKRKEARLVNYFNVPLFTRKSKEYLIKTKVRLFNSNVKTILLYGAETWKTAKSLLHKLQVFMNNWLRRILNIRLPEKISNKELWQKTNQPPVEEELKRRKWRWIGHTLRKPKHNITRQALQWNPQGKRGRGRPRNTWRRDLIAEMEIEGYRWQDLERMSQNRTRWRTVVSGPCTPRCNRHKQIGRYIYLYMVYSHRIFHVWWLSRSHLSHSTWNKGYHRYI